jgi:UDP-3-O-[3-hydroxymyristoyl] glucosamine N-acyltransferase
MIDDVLLSNALGINVDKKIYGHNLGLIEESLPDLITFIDDEKYLQKVNESSNIRALFTTGEISRKITNMGLEKIVVDDPRFFYYKLLNYIGESNYREFETKIDPSAEIHPSAFIAESNVIIGKNVIIDPNASIYPDVEIGDNCIIKAGAVLGQHGYEYKKTKRGLLSVFHAGRVLIGKNVEIRANTCIDKGLFRHRNTVVGDNTKINNLAMIGHGVHVGKSCLIHTCVSISGSSTIGDNVWISPNAVLINGAVVGDNALIGIGAVVISDVEPGAVMVGNPAKMIRRNE